MTTGCPAEPEGQPESTSSGGTPSGKGAGGSDEAAAPLLPCRVARGAGPGWAFAYDVKNCTRPPRFFLLYLAWFGVGSSEGGFSTSSSTSRRREMQQKVPDGGKGWPARRASGSEGRHDT